MFDKLKYTIGWICAIQTELVAAQSLLDEIHDRAEYEAAPNDNNAYEFGQIGKHNVDIAALPLGEYGMNSAAVVARDLIRSFTNVRVGLMVGIGGGAPLFESDGTAVRDIRLGDVVVSKPTNGYGGVWQYDHGKAIQDRAFKPTGHLNQPPQSLLAALTSLGSDIEMRGHDLDEDISRALAKWPRLKKKYKRPELTTDRLYKSSYLHQDDRSKCSAICKDEKQIVVREVRDEDEGGESIDIHYGLIASGNTLLKDAILRDKFARDSGILCIEMEAAGLMNQFPFLVIRGICDYSDSHKNKEWQGYAAMTAAAFGRKLLLRLASSKVEAESKMSELKGLKEALQAVSNEVKVIAYQVKETKDATEQFRLRGWLGAADPSTNFNSALKLRHESSGLWILRDETFQAWDRKDLSFLWLYGLSGCGKTVISSTIIEHLQNSARSEETESVAYFYFDIQDRSKQTLDQALRSLITQVCAIKTNEASRKIMEDLYDKYGSGNRQPTTAEFRDCLRKMSQDKPITILLDAVDECTNLDARKEVLDWIKESGSTNGLSIIFTSRPEYDIKTALPNEQSHRVEIRGDAQDRDIRAFIELAIDNPNGDFSRWRDWPQIQELIKTSLIEKADGMFRWVACQLDVLKNCLDLFSLEDALSSLPKTLEETYDRILQNLPPAYHDNAVRILQFLTYAERPLALDELVDACATRIDRSPAFDKKYRVPDFSELARFCGSLTRTVKKVIGIGDYNDRAAFGRTGSIALLELAHASVKEYLLSDRPQRPFGNSFEVLQARSCILRVCLTYLNVDFQERMALPEHEREDIQWARRIDRPFQYFAAKYWYEFVPTDEDSGMELLHWIVEIMTETGLYAHAIRVRDIDPGYRRDALPHSLLYGASLAGLTALVKLLLAEGYYSASEIAEGYYDNPLSAASQGGHLDIVQALLNHQADMDVRGTSYGTALQLASEGGHLEIVATLLDHGADASAPGGFRGTALEAAMISGVLEIVELLLHPGVQGEKDDNQLAQAVTEYHGGETKPPRNHGADASIGCPIPDAVSYQHLWEREDWTCMMDLLFRAGADIDVCGQGTGTALEIASAMGDIETVRYLLARGAKVNSVVGEYGSALHAAASTQGNVEIVQLLLDAGADINAFGGGLGTALQGAAYCGDDQVVKLLLETGADVRAQGAYPVSSERYYGGAYEIAEVFGDETIKNQLLKAGADPVADALATSSARKLYRAVRRYCRGGHDLDDPATSDDSDGSSDDSDDLTDASDSPDNHGSLHSTERLNRICVNDAKSVEAFDEGDCVERLDDAHNDKSGDHTTKDFSQLKRDIIELIVKGANLDMPGGRLGNALQLACDRNLTDVIKFLLHVGAHVNAPGLYHGNALHIAAQKGHLDVVQLLLTEGADVNALGGSCCSALCAAVLSMGSPSAEVVELLIASGAHLDTPGLPNPKTLLSWLSDLSNPLDLLDREDNDTTRRLKAERSKISDLLRESFDI